jgi:mono/diheme cytochrome c family protein
MMRGLRPILAVLATLLLSLWVPAAVLRARQASGPPAIWKGVFTDAQSERGKAVFQAHCATCHDPREQGEAPLLSGDVFMSNWEGHSVARLYTKIVDEMPANNAGSVSATQKRDAVAFILHENGFPSGARELPAEADALDEIQIVPEDGIVQPRIGAMVVVVGCLAPGASGAWVLTNTTDPVVTTLTASASEKPSSAASLGTRTVQLLHAFPSPDPQRGHRIEAKGFLMRQTPDELAINVVSLRSLSAACP